MTNWKGACLIFIGLSVLGGCHNTAQGVKADTKKALHKTGHGIEKAGDKIDDKEKK